MSQARTRKSPTDEARQISISRVLNAPRELVFKAWTDPHHVVSWWGPRGFTTTVYEMEVKPGGRWRHVMHGPDGVDYPNLIVYSEIAAPERLVYMHGSGADDDPGFEVTVTFAEAPGNRTSLTMCMVFPTAEARNFVVEKHNAIEGGNQTLDRLAEKMFAMEQEALTPAKPPEVTLRRTFNAPRELVFKAWTQAEHLAKWFGPVGFQVGVKTLDLRPGGVFHYYMDAPDGKSPRIWGRFDYQRIVSPELIEFLNSFSDEAGGLTRHPASPTWPMQLQNTLTFAVHEDGAGKTLLTMHAVPYNPTPEENETFAKFGSFFEQGMKGTLDQLEAHLAALQAL